MQKHAFGIQFETMSWPRSSIYLLCSRLYHVARRNADTYYHEHIAFVYSNSDEILLSLDFDITRYLARKMFLVLLSTTQVNCISSKIKVSW